MNTLIDVLVAVIAAMPRRVVVVVVLIQRQNDYIDCSLTPNEYRCRSPWPQQAHRDDIEPGCKILLPICLNVLRR